MNYYLEGPPFVDIIVCSISGTALMFVGFFMMSRPKFRQHPYKIMYWACLMEAMWYYVTSVALLECFNDTLEIGGFQLALT